MVPSTKIRLLIIFCFLLALTLGFGLGYLWRGQVARAPIIIEKNTP